MKRLSSAQVQSYKRDGFIAVEDILEPSTVDDLRATTDAFVARSREVGKSDSVFDFEPIGEHGEAHLRRIKNPERQAPAYTRAMVDGAVLDCIADLIGRDLRFWAGKLNLKRPHGGQAVQWHQDWAFGPATNDDLLTVGVALDEATIENGCLLMIPGSHRGPVLDHWREDQFIGAVTEPDFDPSAAVPVEVRKGGITLHHIRTLHASAPNLSSSRRPAAWDAQMVRGTAVLEPRLEKVPVRRWPRWENEKLGVSTSIFDLQEKIETSAFG
jgi:phytanoyl-CoA hydroxylase